MVLGFIATCIMILGLHRLLFEDEYGLMLIGVVLFILTFAINPTDTIEINEEVSLYSTFNTTEQEGSGGLFYHSVNNKDYLIYWNDNGNFKQRYKIEVEWDIVEVYESNLIDPAIVFTRAINNPKTRWENWMDVESEKTTKIKLYVPIGTVIQDIALK